MTSRPLAKALIALASLAGAMVLYATFVEPQRVSLSRVEVLLNDLPAGLEGLKILQVSDLESRGRGGREDQVASLSRLADADLLVITGDLVAKNLRGERRIRATEAVADLLGEIPSRLGAYFVEGHGEMPLAPGRQELLDALQSRGIRFLHNEIAALSLNGATLALVGLAVHPAGKEARFYQQPDGTIIETGGGRADSYLNFDADGAQRMSDYEFTGQFRFSHRRAGAGVTFYNLLPEMQDRFYRLRRTDSGAVMKLSPHGTVFSRGRSASGFHADAGAWYAFRVRAETASDGSQVRARIWKAEEGEPDAWSIDCVDATPSRLTRGTIGLWTSGPGRKEFRRLGVVQLDGTVLVADGRSARPGRSSWIPPAAPDYLLAIQERLPQGAFIVVLSHSPDPFIYAPALGWPLLLAGHTQGGQIRLPFVGALVTDTVLGRRYASGLFERDGSRVYITRGIGTTRVPFRFLAPPELTLLTLRKGGDATARSAAARDGA